MSKLNIFRKEWLDIVFEGRNKSYGAYQLRSENPKVTTFALFAGIALFGVGLASPLIIKAIEGSLGNNKKDAPLDTEITLVDLATPPPPPVELPPPPPVETPPPPPEATKSVVDTKKFTPPKVVEKEKVVEEIAKVEDFRDKDPGTKDAKGDKEKGDIKTGESTGNADKGTKPVDGDDDGNKVFIAVQVSASPPGGMAGFNKTFISRFRTPDIDSSVKKIQVIVKFIVEKDGSLTDITVLRDPGYGAGKEAVRVLQNMPKWKPAVQNGKNVRSQFTLPITIQVQ